MSQVSLDWLVSDGVWEADGWGVARLTNVMAIPVEFGITYAYPNPFNSVIRISYGLPEAADVRLSVYDILGRLVIDLFQGRLSAGRHEAVLNGVNLVSGIYVARLDAGELTSQAKVVLVK